MNTDSPPSTPEQHPTATEVVAWVQAHDMTLPAWIMVECVRPLGWLLSQGCLLVQPLARGLGWEDPLATTILWLQSPEQLAALSAALAPNREAP